jgi:hypothetical protein
MQRSAIRALKSKASRDHPRTLASLTSIELEASHQACFACFNSIGMYKWRQCGAAVGPGQPDVHRRTGGVTPGVLCMLY